LTNWASLHYKSPEETKNRWMMPQHHKAYMWQTYSQYSTLNGKKTEGISSNQGDDTGIYSFHPYSIQCLNN
jgi:hypothetical protein